MKQWRVHVALTKMPVLHSEPEAEEDANEEEAANPVDEMGDAEEPADQIDVAAYITCRAA